MRRFARSRSFGLCIGVVLFVITWVTTSRADETNAAKVEELKKRGNQAMMDLNYADALEAYKAAIALAPDDAALYYNLGRAQQAREDYPAALDALDQFVQKASPEVRGRVPKLEQLVADVRSRVATVVVQCTADVDDALVAIGDKTSVTGCTRAPKPVRISVPSHNATIDVRLSAPSYQGQSVRLAVEGGGAPVEVTLTVLPKATSGILLVRVVPVDARISVDGVVRGNSPLEVPLSAGAHALDVAADRHDPAHIPVVVEAGKTKDVPVTLQRTIPITSKWWFWTGVGVVAVGIGVTIFILVSQPERDPKPGSIDPGVVSAPLMRF
jgi:hypothetical protein